MSTYGRQVQLQELWWMLQGWGPWSTSGPMLSGGSAQGQGLCLLPPKRDWRLNGHIPHHGEQFRGTWTSRSVWLLETSAMILESSIPELLFEQFLFPFHRELYMHKVCS